MSDFDRSKFNKKKGNSSQNKESGSNFTKSYYGRRSPNSGKESKSDGPKLKQPTILQKSREFTEDAASAASPKRVHKDSDNNATTNQPEPVPVPVLKQMKKPLKFLDDSILSVESLQDYMQENSDFLVVGIVGAQGVGKSTIANLITHNMITEDLKKAIFKSNDGPKEEEYGESVKILSTDERIKHEIFKIQSREDNESNSCTTRGIDLFITTNRVIVLDCQPFNSISALEDLVQSEHKRSNIVSEFIALENSAEIQALQLMAFLMSVCHVLIVVQDYFVDSNAIRFIQSAEMLKPTHFNPEDELHDHFPHLLMVQNRAQMGDYSPERFRKIEEIYNAIFAKTKLITSSHLGLHTGKSLNGFQDNDASKANFNVFLIPECKPSSGLTYRGHPPIEELVKKLRANILGVVKNPLTHVQLTEKTWLLYCSKVWENVRKSSFFVEYTKLMP